jgi:hypothetical protein
MNKEVAQATQDAVLQSHVTIIWIMIGVAVYISLLEVLPVKWKALLIDVLLWFLLTGSLVNLFIQPVDADDELTAAILLVAYVIGQIGRIFMKKSDKAES